MNLYHFSEKLIKIFFIIKCKQGSSQKSFGKAGKAFPSKKNFSLKRVFLVECDGFVTNEHK